MGGKKADKPDWTFRHLVAEFIATMMFVWGGCGAAISSNRWDDNPFLIGPAALTSIALAFGLSISVLIYLIGHISGGHINPAVTFAFVLLRLQSVVSGVLFIIAQLLGAVVGALILWGQNASITQNCDDPAFSASLSYDSGVCEQSRLPDGSYGPAFGLGVNTVDAQVSQGCAFFIEMMGTFLLVLTVLMVAVHKKSGAGNTAPIAIGWAVLVCHLQLIPYTGCGINPARSFGPMVVNSFGGANKWQRGWWVYYTAPFVGSALATCVYYFVFAEDDVEEIEESGDRAVVRDVVRESTVPKASSEQGEGSAVDAESPPLVSTAENSYK